MGKLEPVNTNIRILKPSRKSVEVGDVFVVQMPDDRYTFGRVIDTGLEAAGFPNSILIYFYKHRSTTKEMPDRTLLGSDQLLRGPIFINRLPWSRGYFETIGNLPLEEGDRLAPECFWDVVTQKYLDLHGNEIRKPVEPYGEYGLSSFRTVDDKLSTVLGFPLVPD